MNEEQAKRLRDVEIDVAQLKVSLISIERSIKKNIKDVDKVHTLVKNSKETLDRWGGGVTILTKVVLILCSLVGMTIGVAKYASAQEVAFVLEHGKEDFESDDFIYTTATVSVCKNIYRTVAACAQVMKEQYNTNENDYYSVRVEYVTFL